MEERKLARKRERIEKSSVTDKPSSRQSTHVIVNRCMKNV